MHEVQTKWNACRDEGQNTECQDGHEERVRTDDVVGRKIEQRANRLTSQRAKDTSCNGA